MKKEGICQNCIYKEDCIYKIDSKQQIIYCEEHNSCLPIKTEKPLQKSEAILVVTNSKFTGLCINCDNRNDCTLRNSNHVIWHCEEYI
jgi:hypothetical protein